MPKLSGHELLLYKRNLKIYDSFSHFFCSRFIYQNRCDCTFHWPHLELNSYLTFGLSHLIINPCFQQQKEPRKPDDIFKMEYWEMVITICLLLCWARSLDNTILLLKWHVIKGLMIVLFLSQTMTSVFHSLAY